MRNNKKPGAIKTALFVLGAMVICGLAGMSSMKVQAAGANVFQNGEFAESDVSMWKAASGNATVETAVSEEPIGDEGYTTYGVLKNRTSAYECFAQDVTASVKNGKEYDFEFYCMLSDAYLGAPNDQRVVEFAPYMTVDGTTTYMGSWSGDVTGTSSQTLVPGQWTKFSGTFRVEYAGNLEQVVVRLLEQGTNYGAGDCVKGDYYVTGVKLTEKAETVVEVEDIPALKDEITEDLGADTIVGVAVCESELRDKGVQALVEKHFNAITIGNELKPDALFGYSNGRCPGTEEAELNGKTITVPKLDYSRAEKVLNVIYNWNQEHPEDFIKVRGHVLVWHSQTPEWFFHVDYDKNKDYVTPEEMNLRLEWYIKTVLEHFTGEDSKYKGMFYGWDVVNEAVSDAGGYRTDKVNASEPLSKDTHGSNSSWWHVYQSNEFIINAFRYANKYAPADVELYYNDYNEAVMTKMTGIVDLINAVKEADGTRIDGMGMQAHYNNSDPQMTQFKIAVKKYCEAAGSVMLTEWDLKASSTYDGTEATRADEYSRQAFRYLNLYKALVELKQEGYDVSGITIWGSIDKYSWLQSRSDVGGGASGNQTQCPLLFDDNYNAKPCFWAFVDEDTMKAVLAGEKAEESDQKASEEAPEKEESAESDKEVTEDTSDAATSEATSEAESSEADQEADAPADEKGMNPLWIVLAVVAVVVVAAAAFVLVKKGKKK